MRDREVDKRKKEGRRNKFYLKKQKTGQNIRSDNVRTEIYI